MFAYRSLRVAAAALILSGLAQPMLAGSPFPEPPRAAHKFLPPGTINQFNPQPEPPVARQAGSLFDMSIHSFNPQPEPPPAQQVQGMTPVQR